MTETTGLEIAKEVVKLESRRKRKTRSPKKHTVVRQAKPKAALEEIDRRLRDAIIERADALKKLSALGYWQDKLTRLTREIEDLLSYQQRLSGVSTTIQTMPFVPPSLPPSSTPYAFQGDIPPSISSIPAKQPKPGGANVADVIGAEGGFA